MYFSHSLKTRFHLNTLLVYRDILRVDYAALMTMVPKLTTYAKYFNKPDMSLRKKPNVSTLNKCETLRIEMIQMSKIWDWDSIILIVMIPSYDFWSNLAF